MNLYLKTDINHQQHKRITLKRRLGTSAGVVCIGPSLKPRIMQKSQQAAKTNPPKKSFSKALRSSQG